ncbi:VanZ family protein [Sinomonas mesophila]|uniref:VanZ family protein n=1 Tax=Sinomonas mesophila TaxID=1531955 RepID=UPI001FEAB1F1|nr:VanZ family protein [Sinomonas mesophila]
MDKRSALWPPALVYLAGVAVVVLWPDPVDRPASGDLANAIAWLHAGGLPRWIGYVQIEWLANVAFFVPFGAFAVLLGFPAWAGVLAGAGFSAAAEAAQLALLPERTASLWDIAANALGTMLGAAAVAAVARLRSRRHGLPGPARGTAREP